MKHKPLHRRRASQRPAEWLDNHPTGERAKKPDYELCGKRRRRADTLAALRAAGDIDSMAEEAAGRWLRDYRLAMDGYCELFDYQAPPGDAHTFGFLRGRAAVRLRQIAEILGPDAHRRLVLMLAEGYSFAAIGGVMLPRLARAQATVRVSSACAVTLCALPGAYRAAVKALSDGEKPSEHPCGASDEHDQADALKTSQPVQALPECS